MKTHVHEPHISDGWKPVVLDGLAHKALLAEHEIKPRAVLAQTLERAQQSRDVDHPEPLLTR